MTKHDFGTVTFRYFQNEMQSSPMLSGVRLQEVFDLRRKVLCRVLRQPCRYHEFYALGFYGHEGCWVKSCGRAKKSTSVLELSTESCV